MEDVAGGRNLSKECQGSMWMRNGVRSLVCGTCRLCYEEPSPHSGANALLIDGDRVAVNPDAAIGGFCRRDGEDQHPQWDE